MGVRMTTTTATTTTMTTTTTTRPHQGKLQGGEKCQDHNYRTMPQHKGNETREGDDDGDDDDDEATMGEGGKEAIPRLRNDISEKKNRQRTGKMNKGT